MNTDQIQMTLLGLYVSGWLLDWTYWIAVGWSWSTTLDKNTSVFPVVFGWLPAAFWPLHALAETWHWMLG